MQRIISIIMAMCILAMVSCDGVSTADTAQATPTPSPALTPIPIDLPRDPTLGASGRFVAPPSYYYPNVDAVRALEGKPAPPLNVQNWRGDAVTMDDLRGNVVLVDFWGVWCPPCMRALPKNNELFDTYGDQGLSIVGIHTPRMAENMPATADRLNIEYPVGVDAGGQTARAWGVRFFPTYAAVDRQGIVRAIGLHPGSVETVVKALLAEDPDASPESTSAASSETVTSQSSTIALPARWLEGPTKRARLASLMDADAPPPIQSDTWINSDPLDLESLKGKVVVLDFWGTWCPPCIRSIPKNNQLHDTYKDQGLVLIGICEKNQVDRMGAVVQQHNMRYPTCADDGSMVAAYKVDGYPDYYLIDRQGRLRIADCANGQVEAAIRMLLAEPVE